MSAEHGRAGVWEYGSKLPFTPILPHSHTPILLLASILVCAAGCGRAPLPGAAELPPGIARAPGVYRDVGPRWSHDGRLVAFLRATTDRRYQLCVADAGLTRVVTLLAPEVINPDRPFRPGRAGYRAPDCIAWSPDDRLIAFPRVEWFTFPDGEKLAGTGIWACDVETGAVTPLAVHPRRYKGAFYFYRSPQWSPDGRRLALIAEGLHGETALFVRTLPGSRPEMDVPRFDQYEDTGWPAWSPDGRRLAFRQGMLRSYTADPIETVRLLEPGGHDSRHLFAATPRRTGPRALRASMQEEGEAAAPRVAGISWSPAGTRLAFSIADDAEDPSTYALWTLDLRDPRSARPAPRQDISDDFGYHAPVWLSRDTLGALRWPAAAPGAFELVAVLLRRAAATSPVRVLGEVPSDDLDWSLDGRRVVCAAPGPPRPGAVTTLRVIQTKATARDMRLRQVAGR